LLVSVCKLLPHLLGSIENIERKVLKKVDERNCYKDKE